MGGAEISGVLFDQAWAKVTLIAQEWYKNYGKYKHKYAAHRNTALWAGYVIRNTHVKHIELRLTALGFDRISPIEEPFDVDAMTVAEALWSLADSQGGYFCTCDLGQLYAGHPEYKAIIDGH